VLITFLDCRFLGRLAAAVAPAKWLPWMPIDCEPVCPHDVVAIDGCHTAIAMARYGEDQLHAAGVPNVVYIPLGVEADFVVCDQDARRSYRAQLAGDDCTHLTLIVAANTHGDRKNLPMQIAAWWAFSRNKVGARLYLHTGHRRPGAPDLAALVRELGIGDRVIFAPDGEARFTTAEMVRLYNSADALLSCSRGEGFGLAVVEAQACGCPAIVTNASAQPELIRWGKKVGVVDMTYEPPLGAYWALPDAVGILYALEEMYDEWTDAGGAWPLEQRLQVSAAVHQEYGWDQVFDRCWTPLVQNLVTAKAHSDSPCT
jgi:glycosyltransferase involved in cell wall biosynthesis